MGIFSKITSAKVNRGGVFVLPGIYTVEVLANKLGESREGRPFFVAEFKILRSNNEERPVGSTMAWMQMLDGSKEKQETVASNIKAYVAALFGVDPEEVTEETVDALVAADNPGQGRKLGIVATQTMSKKNLPYTKTKFHTVE